MVSLSGVLDENFFGGSSGFVVKVDVPLVQAPEWATHRVPECHYQADLKRRTN